MAGKFLYPFLAVVFLFALSALGMEPTPSRAAAKQIAIFCYHDARMAPWDPDTVESGITGSEEAVIYISQQLARMGYRVTVFAQPPQQSPHTAAQANPRFVDANYHDGTLYDIGVSWRMPHIAKPIRTRIKPSGKAFLWLHDTPFMQVTDEMAQGFDDVFWLSHYQKEMWTLVCPTFAKFNHIMGNGIVPGQFPPVAERKNPHSCIYASNYGRGLQHLLKIWPEVRKQYPDATLDIYYGWQHWGLLTPEQEAELRSRLSQLNEMGVHEKGRVGHTEINQAFAQCSLWTYPCTMPETFCLAGTRAQMSGTIPVIIKGSALPETVQTGYACDKPDDYLPLLLKAMNEAERATLADRQKGREFVLRHFTWEQVAKKWEQSF